MTRVQELPVMHGSTLLRAPAASFVRDIEFALSKRPAFLTLTEVQRRRAVIRDVVDGTGYRPTFFDSRETAILFDYEAGIRFKGSGEAQAHDAGSDYPARSITFGNYEFSGEDLWVHTGHWLAHLSDSEARLRDHNKMTGVAVRLMRQHGKGRSLSILTGDTNEADKPREDSLLGDMHTQFRKAGVQTVGDELGRYPGTFKGRPIDIVATLGEDRRVEATSVKVFDVKGDHHYTLAGLQVT